MATALGSEGAAPIPIVGDSQGHFAMDDSPSTSPGPQSSPHDGLPLPMPAFSFPARPQSPSSAPSSFSRATGRRPMSAIESNNKDSSFSLPAENSHKPRRSVALPAFNFNPGASLPPDLESPLLSPPITPNSPRTGPSQQRPPGHGHRRGGSEFVGGRLREGSSIAVMSTSPTKPESGFASPTFQPPRRGHRRGVSSAISTNDLPILLPPPINPIGKGSSAPNSPTNFEQQDYMSLVGPGLSNGPPEPRPVSRQQPDDITPVDDAEEPAAKGSPKQARSGTRARVGFSDTLEYIPRPLSMVSSDTSSTATARPGHSVSESLSSIMSGASPSGRDSPAPLSRSPTRDMADSRPSTAGAILEGMHNSKVTNGSNLSPRRRNSIPALLDVADTSAVASPTPSPTKSSKRWSFFGLEPFAGSGSPTKARPCSSSSTESTPRAVSAGSSSEHGSDSPSEPVEATPKHKKSGKKGKKKKVKGWAGVILPRKTKGQSKRSKTTAVRPPTPPASIIPPDDEEVDQVEPQTPEITTPTVTVTESATPPREVDTPKRSRDDPSYPMIDLDAALGPFNTPLPHNPEWEAAQRAAGNVGKRRLHSAQMMKGFSGPGMHYHRRAESAPDLPPFDMGRNSLHRFGSSSTMADVFEEEEEEDSGSDRSEMTDPKSQRGEDSDGETTPPAGPHKAPSLAESLDATPQMVRRKSSGLSDKDQAAAHSVRTERSRTSLQEDVIVEELPSVIFRSGNVFQNDNSSEPPSSPKKTPGGKEIYPVDVNTIHIPSTAAMPTSPYSISHASSYPSPRSPMSVDAQRISTAPSSINDQNSFHSLLMGEPGPEVRISVDYDIPSLTSSTSTMTRESSFIPNPRFSQPTLRDQRPVSVSSAAFGRRRSSLVSLSRLISSSHGERSKLSMEVRLDNESDSKRSRNSKTKRLGRMMQFWKPSKEGAEI